MNDLLKAEITQLPSTPPPAEAFQPYKSQAQQTLQRTKQIFKTHPLQSLLWAACYLLMVNAFLWFPIIQSLLYRSFVADWLPYAQYTLVPLILLCSYAWLTHMLHGDDPAIKGFIDPFRWIKAQSPGRFLWIVFIAAAALYCRDMIINELAGLFVYIARLDTYTQSLMSASGTIPFLDLVDLMVPRSYLELFMKYPLVYVPVFLLLQWVVDFFCIHATQTQGQGVGGVIHSFGIVKKILLTEIRLVVKFQLIPYALLSGALMIVGRFFSGDDHLVIYILAIQGIMLIFSLVYAAQSGIARSLIMMRQPRVQLVPSEPVNFHEIDEQFRREMEEESGEEERLENKEDGPVDGAQGTKEEPDKDGHAR